MRRKWIALTLVFMLIVSPVTALADGFSNDPDAIEAAAKSVLLLEVYNAQGDFTCTGSGFVAYDDSTLITNFHVIDEASYVVAYGDDGTRYSIDRILIGSAVKDLAICRFSEPSGLAPLAFHDEGERLKRAQAVVAIGSPKGILNTVSLGNISTMYEEDGESWIQFTAPISHGSSGGALFDDQGRVIGVTSATYNDGQNINLAIHFSEIKALYAAWDGRYWTFDEYLHGAANAPQPVAPVTLPSGQYAELVFGDRGDAVLALQQALYSMGYLAEYQAGMFDMNTAIAVSLFCKNNGLPIDTERLGVASPEMQALLFAGSGMAQSGITDVPQTTGSYVELYFGDSGDAVLAMQRRLSEEGYLTDFQDGVFDMNTAMAISAYSKDHGLPVDNSNLGVASVELQKMLFGDTAAQPAVTATGDYVELHFGERGSAVLALQQELYAQGYLAEYEAGMLDMNTAVAISAFCAAKDLPVTNDGTATVEMQQALFGGAAAMVITPASEYAVLRIGDSGDAVLALQQALYAQGYLAEYTAGTLDMNTAVAISAFCAAQGLPVTNDGTASVEMQQMLFGGMASVETPDPTPASVAYGELKFGDSGDAVLALQQALYAQGYLAEYTAGTVDMNTAIAISAFCAAQGLPVTNDGTATVEMQQALFGGAAIPAATPGAAPASEYAVLRIGDSGDAVLALQQALAAQGYLTAYTEGTLDMNTAIAISAFCAAQSLPVTNDGTASVEMQQALFGGAASVPAVTYPSLTTGDRGDAVAALQRALIDQGFLTGKADGIFGNMTAEAVRKAQQFFGMAQTGVADDALQQRLFSGATPTAMSYQELRFGDSGDAVAALQRELAAQGYLTSYTEGTIDMNTAAAISAFCAAKGLPVTNDGTATVDMQRALFGR